MVRVWAQMGRPYGELSKESFPLASLAAISDAGQLIHYLQLWSELRNLLTFCLVPAATCASYRASHPFLKLLLLQVLLKPTSDNTSAPVIRNPSPRAWLPG
jgi:hypothetical protein